MSAVKAIRNEPRNSLDDFPTPPWATRALLRHSPVPIEGTVWEPACGRGFMSSVLREHTDVIATDVKDYNGNDVEDFLGARKKCDWVITNPPFNLAEDFALHALSMDGPPGVAFLLRLQWLESKGRYLNLFLRNPPSHVLIFSERVHMEKGRIVKNGGSAMAFAWYVWHGGMDTALSWIPPGTRAELEKSEDYKRQ